MQLVRIGYDKRNAPFEITAFAADGELADIDTEVGDAVGEAVDNARAVVDARHHDLGQEIRFNGISPPGFQDTVAVVGKQVIGIGATGAVNFYAALHQHEPENIVALHRVAAVGKTELVVIAGLIVDDHLGFAGHFGTHRRVGHMLRRFRLVGVFGHGFLHQRSAFRAEFAAEPREVYLFEVNGAQKFQPARVAEVFGQHVGIGFYGHFQRIQFAGQDFLAVFCLHTFFFLERYADAVAGLGSGNVFEPVFAGFLVFIRDDLDLVAVFKAVMDRNGQVVDFGGTAGTPHVGVDTEREIKNGGAFRHDAHFAFGREHVYLIGEQVALHIGQQFDGAARVVVFQRFAHLTQPVIKRIGFVGNTFYTLVFPVRCETALGNLVHTFGADLYFHKTAFGAGHGGVQRFVAVGFRVGDPVFQAFGHRFVVVGDDGIHLPAGKFFLFRRHIHDDAQGKEVVDVLELDVFIFDLVPDGINALRSPGNAHFKIHLFQRLQQRRHECVDVFLTGAFGVGEFGGNVLVNFRLCDFQAGILKFRFDGIEA